MSEALELKDIVRTFPQAHGDLHEHLGALFGARTGIFGGLQSSSELRGGDGQLHGPPLSDSARLDFLRRVLDRP